jgi:hypothetical protein
MRVLDLSGMELGDQGLAYLAEATALAGLTTLRLGPCGITGTGINNLLRSAHFKDTVIELPTQQLPRLSRLAIESRLRAHNERNAPHSIH